MAYAITAYLMAKILIIDDEPGVRRVLGKFFKLKGHNTVEAENGEQALQLVVQEKCPIALLDMKLPAMNGLVVLEKLLRISPDLTVVMVSGAGEEEEVKKALSLGAFGYVLKPFDFLHLELLLAQKLAIAESD